MSPKKRGRAGRHKQGTKRSLAQNVPSGDKRTHREGQNSFQQKPVWSFEVLDIEGPWGWNNDKVTSILWTEIVPKLQSFETMTWGEITQQAGGRKHGNNHHFISVEALTRKVQKRLSAIRQDDIDEIFSFRLKAKTRIYGLTEGQVFKLLWYDPFHGNNREAVVSVTQK